MGMISRLLEMRIHSGQRPAWYLDKTRGRDTAWEIQASLCDSDVINES